MNRLMNQINSKNKITLKKSYSVKKIKMNFELILLGRTHIFLLIFFDIGTQVLLSP